MGRDLSRIWEGHYQRQFTNSISLKSTRGISLIIIFCFSLQRQRLPSLTEPRLERFEAERGEKIETRKFGRIF